MKNFKWNKIKNKMIKKEYKIITNKKLKNIVNAITSRKKDTTITIRINSQDIKSIKLKSKKMGIKYQTFISEILHEIAQSI